MKKILNYYGLFKPINNWRKLLLAMKITAFLSFFGFINLIASPGYAQNTKISLNMQDVPVENVLSKIEEVSEFYFLFNQKLIDVNRKVTILAENKPIKEILREIFPKDISFIVSDRQIVLTSTMGLSHLEAELQQQAITGSVTDENNNPLPGVTVLVKGTTMGALTDAAGKYVINNAPQNATLIFSFIGMTSQEVQTGGRNTINIILKEEAIGLDEVIVIGYGTQKKQSITSSIASMSSKDLVESPNPNVSNALIGRISGITALQNIGIPGSDQSALYIRGLSTTGSTNPLYVIDGIPRESIDFQRLAPTEIDNISVLKDASAAAVYGTRAANGVILITTKRGASQKPTFSYSINYGIQQSTRMPDFLDSYQFADLYNKALINEGKAPIYSETDIEKYKDGSDPIFHPNTDWMSLYKGTSPMSNHNLSLTGGTDRVKYYLSLNYLNQQNIISDAYGFTRYNFRSNIDVQVTNTTKVAMDISGYMGKSEDPSAGYGLDATRVPNIYVGKYPNGMWGPGYTNRNQWASLLDGGKTTINKDGLFARMELLQVIPFIKGLSIKGLVAFDYKPGKSKIWTLPVKLYRATQTGADIVYDQVGGFGLPSLTDRMEILKNQIFETHAMYDRSFGKNNINGLVLFSRQVQSVEDLGASRTNFLSDQLDILDAGGKAGMINSGSANQYHRQSIVSRLTYNYDTRYLLELSFRYDGSDLFALGKRFGFFPAISAGWVISREEFMTNLTFIDNLKLRGSYGTLGNDQISQYQYLAFYTFGTYGIGMGSGSGFQDNLYLSRLKNVDVTWEKSKKTNIGIESTLFKNFTLEADLFWENRNDILGKRSATIPDYFGVPSAQLPYENFQKVSNKGMEVLLGYNKYFSNGISLETRFNFSHAQNTVIDIGEADDKPERIREEGRPLNSRFGYKAVGIFQSTEEINEAYGTNYPKLLPGDIRYEDLNGDKKIDGEDITYIGSSNLPINVFGLSSRISYKGIAFSMFWQAGTGNHQYLSTWIATPLQQAGNALEAHLDYWTPDNTDAKYPRITTTSSWNYSNTSSYWLYDMKYLRLKNIEIAYSLPTKITQNMRLQNIRVYFNAVNLLTFSPYKVVDPEATSDRASHLYPQQIIYNFGAQFSF